MNVIGYVRVSTEDQARSGLGLEAQEAAIISACRDRGWNCGGQHEFALFCRRMRETVR